MSKNATNLQSQLDELERIVAWFEGSDIDIEQAIEQFEKGAEKSEAIAKQLESLENKITVLKQRFDQAE